MGDMFHDVYGKDTKQTMVDGNGRKLSMKVRCLTDYWSLMFDYYTYNEYNECMVGSVLCL